jgi:hypothetical protein
MVVFPVLLSLAPWWDSELEDLIERLGDGRELPWPLPLLESTS